MDHRQKLSGRVCWANLINYVGDGFTSAIAKFVIVGHSGILFAVTISGRRLITDVCKRILIGNVVTLNNLKPTMQPIKYILPNVSSYYLFDDESGIEAGPQGLGLMLPIPIFPVPINELRGMGNDSYVDVVAYIIGIGKDRPGFPKSNSTDNPGEIVLTLIDQTLCKVHLVINQDEYTFGQFMPSKGSTVAIKFAQIAITKAKYVILNYGRFLPPLPEIPQVKALRDFMSRTSKFQLATAPLV